MLRNVEDLESSKKYKENVFSQLSEVRIGSSVLSNATQVSEKIVARLEKGFDEARTKLSELSMKINVLKKERKIWRRKMIVWLQPICCIKIFIRECLFSNLNVKP